MQEFTTTRISEVTVMSTAEKFTSERLSERVWRLKDAYGVAMYLVEGTERACLIDTGYGIKGLREYVESLTDKPLEAHHEGTVISWAILYLGDELLR